MSASETPTRPNQPAGVARQAGQEDSRTAGETKRFYPKTHANFWKSKLEHRTYSYDGKMCEVPEWSVRIQFKGIRRSFDLETANKEEAAAKARDIYLSLVTKGWSATLAELTPQPITPVNMTEGNPTVGEFLAEVERTSTLKPKTFHRYAQYFRMMAAQIQGVKSDRSRYNYRTGGLTNWHERVDTIPLSAITPAAVADWKIAYLKRAGSDPRRRLEVNRSFNSALRHCKSLFSAQIINQPNFGVKIPRFKVRDIRIRHSCGVVNGWQTDDHYLSGNVREKLAVADAAAVTDPRFHENVEALKSVQPADLSATEIDVRLGASWLPPEDVKQFAHELLNIPSGVEIGHVHALGTWHINGNWEARGATANTTDWGTNRYTALELTEDALNLKTPTVYDLNEDKKPVVNAEATEAAREKQERIKDRFKE